MLEEFEGGMGRQPRNKEDRSGGKAPTPGAQTGTYGYIEELIGGSSGGRGGGRRERDQSFIENLVKLTPYALPVEAKPAISTDTSTAAAAKRALSPREAAASMAVSQDYPAADRQAEEKRAVERTKTEPKVVRRRTYEMTWDEYNKLSDEQRAAVDFNTLLIQAREKDLNTEYEASPEEKERYNAQVEQMFGATRGSETFAPETLAVLKQIDFKSDGEDLDDFLSLKTAIGVKDLKDFSFEEKVLPPELPRTETQSALSPYGAGGLETEQRAATYTANLQESMAKAGELIQNFKASAALDRSLLAENFGGTENEVNVARGFGADKGDEYFRMAFEALANKQYSDPDTLSRTLQALNERLAEPQQMKAFLRYVDDRTRNAAEFGAGLGETQGATYRPAQEIRQLVGLDKGA